MYKGRSIYKVIKRFIHSNELMVKSSKKVEITRKNQGKGEKKVSQRVLLSFHVDMKSSNSFVSFPFVTCALLYIILASIINYLSPSPRLVVVDCEKNFVFTHNSQHSSFKLNLLDCEIRKRERKNPQIGFLIENFNSLTMDVTTKEKTIFHLNYSFVSFLPLSSCYDALVLLQKIEHSRVKNGKIKM